MLALIEHQESLVLAPQVIVELWVVATRPLEANGFSWSVEETAAAIAGLRKQFVMPNDGPGVFDRWLNLVKASGVRGKRAHDARLAAFMLAHDIPFVLTLNVDDFSGFAGVSAIHPTDVPVV